MSLPFFYAENTPDEGRECMLDEETSKHIVQVLRMKIGEQLRLTDGKGNSSIAEILVAHKKQSAVKIITSSFSPANVSRLTIGISLIKNPNRFEWFLEKAAELGVNEIIPLICERTEKQHARYDRFLNIARSAMLQSAQTWLTTIQEPLKFKDVVERSNQGQKFIAHCEEGIKQPLSAVLNNSRKSCKELQKKYLEKTGVSSQSKIILIGPEGDFSPTEIKLANQFNFEAVSLGKTRLRTETAGIFAAVMGSS
ncbi:MAG: RsmE family RNA methyltransferase [Flavitalea sp.]